MGIVEFLEARIAEDEAVATYASAESGGPDWAVRDIPWEGIYHFATSDDPPGEVTAVTHHMDIHDPARVLREVAAKRELLELHYDGNPGPGDIHYCGTCHDYYKHDAEDWPCETVRVLASTFSDHPDFNEEWRP